MKNAIAIAAVAGIASAATAQSISVTAAPSTINPGESYTVTITADSTGVVPSGDNGVAFAGFGLTISVDNGVIGLADGDTSSLNQSYLFGAGVTGNGDGSFEIVGGQTANLFGLLNPGIDLSTSVQIISFEVTGAAEGFSTVSVATTDGRDFGAAWYPDSQAGASVELQVSESATVEIVPTPAAVGLLGLGGLVAARRRR